MWWRLQPHVVEAATTCGGGCNHMFGGCNRMWWRLQPHVVEAATACGGGTMMSTPQTIRKEANSHVPLDCRM